MGLTIYLNATGEERETIVRAARAAMVRGIDRAEVLAFLDRWAPEGWSGEVTDSAVYLNGPSGAYTGMGYGKEQ